MSGNRLRIAAGDGCGPFFWACDLFGGRFGGLESVRDGLPVGWKRFMRRLPFTEPASNDGISCRNRPVAVRLPPTNRPFCLSNAP
jgi:hypothetical protein